MIEVIRTLPSIIKDWKVGRDVIYQHLGCVAGILTIVAYIRQQRPSEVLAELFNGVGAHRIGAWFETSLPVFIAQPNPVANHLFMRVAGIAVIFMLVMPFLNARKNETGLDFQAAGLLGARAPSTVWLSLMFAAQFGSLQWGISWLLSLIWVLVTVFVILLIILLVAYLAICKLQIQELFVPVLRALWRCGAHSGVVLTIAAFALIIVVAGPLLGFVVWLFSTVSDAHYEAQRRIEQRRAERAAPSGAKPIRRTA